MLATLLGLWGHDTRVARDGLAAIDVGNDFHPHVVLLDIGLPRLDGYQTAKRIRELAWGKTVTLAAVTGWGRDTDRQLSQDAGFDHHLVKPVSSPALRSLLETCAK
jgi:two-component system, chemotaxis family, CheB/CheR fusion protein